MFKYVKFSLLMFFLCNWVFTYGVHAATINAVSCSQADVQSAVDSASNGDTVVVPSGDATWLSQVYIDTPITLQGQGLDNTIITKTGGDQALYIKTSNFRITGFYIKGNAESYGIQIKYAAQDFRIDHCKFEKCNSRAILVDGGWVYGLIDHNSFLNCGATDIVVFADNTAAWDRPHDLGAALGKYAVYVEDNTFTYTEAGSIEHSISSNDGARYVFRHNTITAQGTNDLAAPIDVHGKCFNPYRGSLSYEIYENTIDTYGSYRGMFIRGGTGVIFNNTLIGNFTHPIHLSNYSSWYSSCKNDNICGENDYPCDDQINNLYIWNNTLNGAAVSAAVDDRGYNTVHIQEGRDYFHMQKPGYTPYEYPHPLATTGGSQPSAPSNLRTERDSF